MSTDPIASVGPADHAAMRRSNRALVVDYLRRFGLTSRSDIASSTGLARPTVSMIVSDLIDDGIVQEVGPDRGSAAGRPRVLLRFNARSSYLLAVHVGVLRTTIVIGDALGATITTTTAPTPDEDAEAALDRIAYDALDALERAGAERSRLVMAGFSLPGLVDTNGTLLLAPNLGWRLVPVSRLLSERLGVPVVSVNATKASMVAEAHEGAAIGDRDAVLVYAGTGVGAAVISSGVLHQGARGISGEFGHVRAVPDGEPCTCGKTGCLETLTSAEAVARDATARWLKSGVRVAPVNPDSGITALDVALAATRGDEMAIAVLDEAGGRLGRAAAWLVNLYNPTCLILAGGLAGAGDTLFDAFRREVEADAMPEALVDLRIQISALGQEAEVRGALLLAAGEANRISREGRV